MPKITDTIRKKTLSRKIINELKKNPDAKTSTAAKAPGAARKMSTNLDVWKLEQMWDLMKTDKAVKGFKPKQGETEAQSAARFKTLLKKT